MGRAAATGQEPTFDVLAYATALIVKIIKEKVAKLRMLFPIALAMVATTAFAQVELRLAYMTERPNTIPAVFPNDHLFSFMTASAYISASELKKASVSQTDERIGGAVRIAEFHRQKFNWTWVAAVLQHLTVYTGRDLWRSESMLRPPGRSPDR